MEPTENDKRIGEIIATHLRQFDVDRWMAHDPSARPTREEVHACGYAIVSDEPTQKAPTSPQQQWSEGAHRIAGERLRQLGEEGYTLEHDREHGIELTIAAVCYVVAAQYWETDRSLPSLSDLEDEAWEWPWEPSTFKPAEDAVRNLEKAGALIAAEIDRLLAERAKPKKKKSK